jgi:hypothetical protein
LTNPQSVFWAITSYFNPAGYHSRLPNYKIFRSNLAMPLIAVELSFTGQFDLGPEDADILVQITGGDVLWQKERLLNLALASLPADCEYVAWIDGDVVFLNRDWPAQALVGLQDFTMIHLFGERCNLGPGAHPGSSTELCDSLCESVARKIRLGTVEPSDLYRSSGPLLRRSTPGLAWAMRRDVLELHGLYDACILGSGDRAMLCAAVGRFDYGIDALMMGTRQSEHYLAWARPFYDTVRGAVGYVDGRICHLWHGDLVNRRYSQRHEGLAPFGFDPFTDIMIDPNGCWRWTGRKTEMQEYVRGYFESRKEDG